MIPTIIVLLILFFCAVWCLYMAVNTNTKLNNKIRDMEVDRYMAEKYRTNFIVATITESDECYSVWLHDGDDILIRNFDKADDAEFARIRAEELCDTLNADF